MNATAYLTQFRRATIIVEQLRHELIVLRANAEYHAQDISTEKVQTSPQGDSMVNNVAQIIAAEHELAEKTAGLLALRSDIVLAIQSLPNAAHIDLLYRRYVQFQPWAQIAREMNYSKDYVRGILHKQALKEMDCFLVNHQTYHTIPHCPVV